MHLNQKIIDRTATGHRFLFAFGAFWFASASFFFLLFAFPLLYGSLLANILPYSILLAIYYGPALAAPCAAIDRKSPHAGGVILSALGLIEVALIRFMFPNAWDIAIHIAFIVIPMFFCARFMFVTAVGEPGRFGTLWQPGYFLYMIVASCILLVLVNDVLRMLWYNLARTQD